MDFRLHGHRHGDYLFKNLDEYAPLWQEVTEAISCVTDEMIIGEFESNARAAKSISQAINILLKYEFIKRGWQPESYIFADEQYAHNAQSKGTWRLDFAKDSLSVEVAFNHRSDISWNLLKPTLASELNHVEKAIQTSGGIIITATEAMKKAGGFDNACGTFEDYVQYLRPLGTILAAPLVIIGLEPPTSFEIEVKSENGRKVGHVKRFAQ